MANKKTITSATTSNDYTLKLELTESGTSTANNTSTVAWKLVLTSGGWSFSQFHVGWSVNLNGTVVSSKSKASAPQVSINKNGSLTVISGSTTIVHGSDGTLTMIAAASIDMDTESFTPGPMSLSGSMVLTDIPRASSLTAANGTLGTAQTLTIQRASSGFTHTLSYTCGSASGTIAIKTSNTSVSWTPPVSLAAQNTTGVTVAVKLTLITFNGSTEVGRTTRTVSMAIPSSVKPTASATVALVNDNATVSGWGVAVKGYSKYKVTATFTGAQGSTVAAYEIKANGQTLTSRISTTGVLTSTSRTVKVRVKDSRGRWSDTVTVNGPVIYNYGSPAITTATAYRSTSGGTASDTGTYLRVKCSGTIYTCGGNNEKTVQCRRRASGGSWTSWLTLTNGTAQTVNAGLSATASYEAQFRISDSLGASRTVTVTIPTATVTMNLRAGGNGAAFGKYAEADGELQVAWDLKLSSPLGVASGGTGQSSRYTAVTVTPDTSVAADHAITVRYYPYLGMCFIRGYLKLGSAALAANTAATVATIPEGYRPGSHTALAVSILGGGNCRVHSDGTVKLSRFATTAAGADLPVYFSGWWMV